MNDPLPDLIDWLGVYEARQRAKKAADDERVLEDATEFIYETSTVELKKKRCCKRQEKFPEATRQEAFKKAKGRCAWCKKPILGKWHAHHRIPKSQGGDNSLENLMVLHPECHNNPLIYEVLHPGIPFVHAFNATPWKISK